MKPIDFVVHDGGSDPNTPAYRIAEAMLKDIEVHGESGKYEVLSYYLGGMGRMVLDIAEVQPTKQSTKRRRTKDSTFFPPFGIGDVVSIRGSTHIIEGVSLCGVNNYEYSTNHSAWHPHEECTLISRATEASIRQLMLDTEDEC